MNAPHLAYNFIPFLNQGTPLLCDRLNCVPDEADSLPEVVLTVGRCNIAGEDKADRPDNVRV